MSKTEKELREEFEVDYKVEPDLLTKAFFDDEVIAKYRSVCGSKQVGGDHYAKHAIQPWDIIDDWHLDYYLGNVIKYVLRDKHDQVEDLHKAIHYLEKKIQLLEKE